MSEENADTKKENSDSSSFGITPELKKEIVDYLEQGKDEQVRKIISQLHAADIAYIFNFLSREDRSLFVQVIKKDFDPDILVNLEDNIKAEIIDLLGTKASVNALSKLDADEAIEVMEDLGLEEQQKILLAMPDQNRLDVEEGLSYPENSAGRILHKNFASVPEYWSVGQTIDYLRAAEADDLPKDFYQIFVVDPKFRPVGGVALSHIMRAQRNEMIKDLMYTDLRTVDAFTDQEEIALMFKRYQLSSAPVIDSAGRMIGIIEIDDIVEVIDEEAQEDIFRLAGITSADLQSSFAATVAKRFPWLLVNLITAIVASVVIWFFESTIAKLASLAVLMPIIASMGGNSGNQTLTIAVRAIATKELTSTNALRVIIKEIMVSLANGFLFAVIAGISVFFWYNDLTLSIIFAIAIIITLALAGLSGALIPLLLEKAGVDPAVASGVFLTTITDVVGFGVFLCLAALILL